MANENGVNSGFQFRPASTDTSCQKFQKAIYNPATGEFLGRTGKNWGQLLLFYTLFYIVLAALFAICMQGLLASLDDKKPTWTMDSSLIGTNPGLGFRPISNRTEEGSLIWYNIHNETTLKKWSSLLTDFLAQYRIDQTGKNFQKCDFDQLPSKNNVCSVDLSSFGNCGPSKEYGYKLNSTSFCVYLKLNKIIDWKPDVFSDPDDEMPEDLKRHILEIPVKNRNQVWISCYGEGDSDKEFVNTFKYYPTRGFPHYYFPYENTANYLSPLIAVEIVNPKPNVTINIECRAWAKNIIYHGGDLQREGSTHFEVMQDH